MAFSRAPALQLNPLDCTLNFDIRDGTVGSAKTAGAFAYMWAGARTPLGELIGALPRAPPLRPGPLALLLL